MAPPTQLRRGDTPVWDLAVLDTNGDPFNLTGYTIRMTAKTDIDDTDADAVFQLSTTTGEIVITNAAGGLATIQPERSSTNTLTTDITVYCDVQIADDGAPDVTYTVVPTWTMRIVRDITRTAP